MKKRDERLGMRDILVLPQLLDDVRIVSQRLHLKAFSKQ